MTLVGICTDNAPIDPPLNYTSHIAMGNATMGNWGSDIILAITKTLNLKRLKL